MPSVTLRLKLADGSIKMIPMTKSETEKYTKTRIIVGIFAVIEDQNGGKIYLPTEAIVDLDQMPEAEVS
jgi:hypothetical protein